MAEEEKEEEPKKGGLMRIIMLALGAIALINWCRSRIFSIWREAS